MKILNAENVSYAYKSEEGETLAVRNVSLSIEQGEFVVLLGHNGCGKSTLAKLLNGLLLPTEGTVSVYGTPTTDPKKIYEIRSKVGMVFQNPDNQTVASIIEDDIAFGPENLGVNGEEISRRVEEALEAVGMLAYRKGTPFKLSGGQKQRIAIASVLAMHPDVLILDESTAMLDPCGRQEVLDTVRHLNREKNMAVLLITHYMDEALSADRILVMEQGEIVRMGSPKEIFGDINLIKECKLELPISCKIGYALSQNGFLTDTCLTDEELVEAVCRLS